MQPQPQSHTYYQIEYNIMKQFTNMYNSTHNKDLFECFVLDALLYSKNCHFIARFNDYLIWDYVDEFLKREYSRKESVERLPKFSEFYKNYLTFFCTPTFCDFYFNTVIQEHSENKAEIYYNEHFVHKANKKKENDNNKNVDAHLSGENSLYSSSNYNKYTTSKYKGKVGVLFDTINKRKIEHNTIMSMTNFLFGNENGKDNTLVFGSSSGNNKNGNSMVNSNNSSVKYSNQQTLANIINELIHKPKKINIHDNNNSNSNNKDKRITFNKHIKSSLKIKPKGMGVNVNANANNNNNSSSNNTNQHIKHHQLHKNNSNIQQFNQNTPSVLTAITVSNSSTRKIPSQTVHKDNNEAQLTSHNNNNNNNNNHINIQQHQQHHSRNPPSHTQAFPSFNTLTKSQTQRDHFQSASNHNITSSSTNVFRQTLHKTNTIETILRQIAYKHLPTKSFNKQKQTQPHYIHIHNINNTNNNNNNTKSSKPKSTSKTKTPNLFSIDTFFIAKNIPHRNTHLNYNNNNNNNNQHLPIRNIKSKDLFRYQLPPKSTSIKKYTNNINHNNNNNNNNNDSNTMKFAFSLLVNNNNNNNHTNMHTHSNFSNHHHHRSNSHHKHSHSNSHNPNINNNNNVFKCGSGLTASNKNIHNININISNHINIMNSNNNNNRRSRNKNIYEIGTNGSNGNSAHNKIIFSSYPGYSLKGIKLTSNNNNNNNSGVVNNSSTQKGKVNMFQTANLFKSFSKLKIKAYTDKERIGCKNIKKGNGCPIKKIYNKQQSSNNNNNNNVNGNGVYCTLNHEGKKKCK